MNCEVSLQDVVQDLLLRGDASNNLIHLGNDGAEEGGRTEEEEDAEDLHTHS